MPLVKFATTGTIRTAAFSHRPLSRTIQRRIILPARKIPTMRFVRYEIDDRVMIGTLDGNALRPALGNGQPYACMRKFIEAWCAGASPEWGKPIPASSARLLHPVKRPEKIFCIGLNYSDHAAETGATVGEVPVVFSKFSSALAAPGDPIQLPSISEKVDLEGELVVVIGKGGRNIPRESAVEHVFGYACGNDVSARDWQKEKPGGQWLLGKTFDTFAPMGPAIVTAEEIGWPVQLDVRSRLNQFVMQESNTSKFIFPIDFLVSHLSQFCCLRAGDLIFTGTPSGVGSARVPPLFLKPGDVVEVEIERIGTLTNPVIAS
jgi:2-keto-4-pentenoate hydratase/2-oxohepta-3-ene-1,7-dioic acid hydratase in catechol pathway